jgi:hypothetical protein
MRLRVAVVDGDGSAGKVHDRDPRLRYPERREQPRFLHLRQCQPVMAA